MNRKCMFGAIFLCGRHHLSICSANDVYLYMIFFSLFDQEKKNDILKRQKVGRIIETKRKLSIIA